MDSRIPDLYLTLGINRTASPREIKNAFRKLALKYHPDKNPGDKTAEERFKEINNAYEVLGDESARKQYDRGENLQDIQTKQRYREEPPRRQEAHRHSPTEEEFQSTDPLNDLLNAIQTGNGRNVKALCQLIIARSIPVPEEVLVSAIPKFAGIDNILTIMRAVTRTGGKISDETLIAALFSPWREELLPHIITEINNTNGLITFKALHAAIKSGNRNFVSAISKLLATNKIVIPEKAIIAIIQEFTGHELAEVVLRSAQRSGTIISEASLIVAMKSSWRIELLPIVMNAIKESGGPVGIETLNGAIENKHESYVKAISQLFSVRKTALPETTIVSVLKNFPGYELAEIVIRNAVRSGTTITDKVLLAAMGSTWRNELLPIVIDAIKESNNNLQLATLDAAIANKQENYIKSISLLLSARKILIPEETVVNVIVQFSGYELAEKVIRAAVNSGTVLSDATLLAAMNSSWRRELLPIIITAIKDTKGDIKVETLNTAIDKKDEHYVKAISQLLVTKKVPIPEQTIIQLIKQFPGSELAINLLHLSAKSGTAITENLLSAAMKSSWRDEIIPAILEEMSATKATLSLQRLTEILPVVRSKSSAFALYFSSGNKVNSQVEELAKKYNISIDRFKQQTAAQDNASISFYKPSR